LGIPFSEAENVIYSLKGSVLRICPRDRPHECDFSEDPFDLTALGIFLNISSSQSYILFLNVELGGPIEEQHLFRSGLWARMRRVFMCEYRLFLIDIIGAIDEIEEFTSGMDFTEFLNHRKNQKVVVKNIEIIGEAAKNVPDEIKEFFI